MTNQEKFIQIFGIDTWQQMIVFSGLAKQFKEYWTSPYYEIDCRNCKEFEDCPCGKDGHESGTSQGYSIGECKDFEPQESDHKCHSCKHYTSGEHDGSCGSYICKEYSNWESEDKE